MPRVRTFLSREVGPWYANWTLGDILMIAVVIVLAILFIGVVA